MLYYYIIYTVSHISENVFMWLCGRRPHVIRLCICDIMVCVCDGTFDERQLYDDDDNDDSDSGDCGYTSWSSVPDTIWKLINYSHIAGVARHIRTRNLGQHSDF